MLYHASVAAGLEPAAAMEVRSLGLDVRSEGRGLVRFAGTAEDGARAALALRSATRVVLELADGLPDDPAGLLGALAELPWEDALPAETTWAARAVGSSESLRDTRYTARLVKDAVRDRCRAQGVPCPPVDPADPQVLVEIRIDRGAAMVGLDLGGGSLHLRGTGRRGEAPLREDIAAGLALLAGVSPERPLLDPFCGTGTMLAEAASVALGIPPPRDPMALAFSRLPHFDDVRPQRVARELRERASSAPHAPMLGFDRDPHAVREARAVLGRLGLAGHVTVHEAALPDLPLPELAPGLLFSNPPWGVRLAIEDAEAAWSALGRFAHGRLAGWTLALLSGNTDVTRRLGLKAERRFPVIAGGVDCRLLVYQVRASSRP